MSDTNVTTSQVLYPAMRYADAHAAIRFLSEAFVAVEKSLVALLR